MIQRSLNQIKSETIKAAKGIKLEHGLADDLGNMSAFLASNKINFSNDLCYSTRITQAGKTGINYD